MSAIEAVTNPVVIAFMGFLALLLAASMALGAVRWLGGESFLPELGRGKDRHFQDKNGRLGRERSDGTVEEGRHPSSALGGFVKGYVIPLVCGAVALPFILASNAGASTWLYWVVFGGGCWIILRFGRNRGWY
jgi:hypothetical protein